MIVAGFSFGARVMREEVRVLVKTFSAMEMDRAPPRELKNMARASVY
jgi:hypothetical protein